MATAATVHPEKNNLVGSNGNDPLAVNDGMRQKKSINRNGEIVYYDSSKAKRSCLGSLHYCTSCPGWNKVTNMRFLYSRWEEKKCCGFSIPCGRQLDTFDSDIVVDISAHQSCFQICRGEGDIMLWRQAGGDLSCADEVVGMTDVPNVFDLFSALSLELSKINLKDAASLGLGNRMGANLRNYDARAGDNGAVEARNDPSGEETIFYDSVTAERTLLGQCCHHDICMPPIYKITSERLMYVEWDVYHPCDAPFTIPCLPFFCIKAFCRDMCCGFGAGRAQRKVDAVKARKLEKEKEKTRSYISSCCCACPIGRTANFMDIDLVADVGAHQKCSQLGLNEGDLLLYVMSGGDASNDADENGIFHVYDVPEVFAKFDEISYDLSQMNLKNYRQNAMANEIRQF